MPTTGRIGQLALMQMKSSSRLVAANAGVATSQVVLAASTNGYGEDEASFKRSMHSMNLRQSSYQGRPLRGSSIHNQPGGGYADPLKDRVEVRIRGKDNSMVR
mmetsp:Transcript_38034/g.46484  ORF Transcript_38034/g.46484 Transcript_38034/m.46484 type:complete len:103 (+) Transcript_38034:2930-3238(+)